MKRHPHHRRSQLGASLLVVMVMVSVIGLMTLTAFYLARNQYRLVGNIQHLEQAFNQTEAVIAAAESWLNTGANHKAEAFTVYDAAQPHLHPYKHLAQSGLDPKTMGWTDANSLASGDGRYLIEQLAQGHNMPGNSLNMGQRHGACRSVNLFRTVARSNSIRGTSRTIEATYATDGC